jgi:hypothetical protein
MREHDASTRYDSIPGHNTAGDVERIIDPVGRVLSTERGDRGARS